MSREAKSGDTYGDCLCSFSREARGTEQEFIKGLDIELTRFVKSPLPLFAKERESLPLEKGGQEGFP
jgi:hypothetical protein